MSGQGRPTRLWLVVAPVLVACLLRCPALGGPPPPVTADMAACASLTDVTFVDAEFGWAVGDRGVIWHTRNSGEHWHTQSSPVGCRLESVCFVDRHTGWAVGGWTHPYTHKSTGVVLQTRDSGRNWHLVERHLLPKLTGVRFLNAQTGVVWGAASALYSSGIWRTSDGGRTFTPQPGTSDGGWTAGDAAAAGEFVLAGPTGKTAIVQAGRISPSQAPQLGLRKPRRMRLRDDGIGLLVGDGGLALVTIDGGRQWHVPPQGPHPDMARHFDFAAADFVGQQAWIAGSPGTYVFHTADGGRTWQEHATGQPLPIYGLCFVDDHRGWAVGALGTILATQDSGRTWQRQKGGGTRVAALGLFGAADFVPLEALAQISANHGYLTAVETIGMPADNHSPMAETAWGDRVHDALVLAGASATAVHWRFPLGDDGIEPDARSILAAWDRAGTSDSLTHARQVLVRAIRQWRPDVVLTHGSPADDRDSFDALVQDLVLAAVRDAAQPQREAGRRPTTGLPLTELQLTGLQPWQVRRVLGGCAETSEADVVLTTSQLVPRLGRSLADQAAAARQLISVDTAPSPATLAFRKLTEDTPRFASSGSARGSSDFFSGMRPPPDAAARQPVSRVPITGMSSLRKQVQLRRNLEQLMAKSSEGQSDAARLGQIAYLVRELDPDAAAGLLHHLALHHQRVGEPELAAETFEWLVNRYGDHPLAESALLWLIRYYASGEMAWQLSRRSQVVVSQVSAENPLNRTLRFVTPVGGDWSAQNPGGIVRLPGAGSAAARQSSGSKDVEYAQARKAVVVANTIRGTLPSLAAEPAVGLPEAAAVRRLRRPAQAEPIYRRIAGATQDSAWWGCAQAELGANPQKAGPPPKMAAHCVRVTQRPMLDGKLKEACWQTAPPIDLRDSFDDQADCMSRILLARDDEYLYIAIECMRTVPDFSDEPPGVRPRDADLADKDRIDLLIDIDRDYATYYRLSIDERGFTSDTCWGDKSWNPQWYVAAAPDERAWIVEAAIPWRELAPEAPRRGERWAIGVQRTIPGVTFQSWTRPASIRGIPRGFGLLVFD
jgi:photosystem II stability/assembly factor-like uncharacterized protein